MCQPRLRAIPANSAGDASPPTGGKQSGQTQGPGRSRAMSTGTSGDSTRVKIFFEQRQKLRVRKEFVVGLGRPLLQLSLHADHDVRRGIEQLGHIPALVQGSPRPGWLERPVAINFGGAVPVLLKACTAILYSSSRAPFTGQSPACANPSRILGAWWTGLINLMLPEESREVTSRRNRCSSPAAAPS